MDIKNFFMKFMKTLIDNAVITAIIAVTWLILGWLKSYDIDSILLFPFNFISGALNGIDGGSFIGGIIGKAIVLMLLSNLLKPQIFTSNEITLILSKYIVQLKGLKPSKILHYSKIKQIFSNKHDNRNYNLIGFGLAFIVYPFITGNGSFQNSGVSLLIAIFLYKELKKQRSHIITIVNSILRKFKKIQISRENIKKIINGNALGFSCTVVYSIFNQNNILPYSFGIIIIIVGFFKLIKATKLKVEVA